MSTPIYKIIELAGSSRISIEDAIEKAITKASETVRHLSWFEVSETLGYIEDGKITQYQVILKIGFTLDS
ncbi:MAG: Dodecin [Legionellaceae bacterium]